MKKLFVFFLLIHSFTIYAQDNFLKVTLDSIIKEADILYNYEKVAWTSTDLFMANKKLANRFGGYVIFHSNDSIFISFIDQNQKERIAIYCFLENDLSKPISSEIKTLPLSSTEQKLADLKIKIFNQLSDEQYEVSIPQDYSPNFIFINGGDEFRFYIIMGTSESGVIPFGNDYLFRTDLDGNITNWKKFHSRMIPTRSLAPNGEKVRSITHSHLKSTPYITATDICTFRLYATYCDLKEFQVLCTATGNYYTYYLETNSIEVKEP